MRKRVIPVLLLINKGLYKTVKFRDPVYVGDPLNAVKIFNEKEVDELIFLDIMATKEKREPDYNYIEKLASECFMPLTYGGGINQLEQIKRLNNCGVEKIAINSATITDPEFVMRASEAFGSSTIVISVDTKQDIWGRYKVFGENGKRSGPLPLIEHVKKMDALGAGEILLTNIDREGSYKGYDLKLIEEVSKNVNVPVIAHGGARSLEDLAGALKAGASAVAAGSLFVFYGPHKAVLINYPSTQSIDQLH